MTLLLFDAMQEVITQVQPHWSRLWSSYDTGRDGMTRGAGIAYGSSGSDGAHQRAQLPHSVDTCIMGAAFFLNSSSEGVVIPPYTSGNPLLEFRNSSGVQLVLNVNSTPGYLDVRRTSSTGTLLGTTSGHAPLVGRRWTHIQVKVKLHSTNGLVVVKIDNQTVLELTDVATASSDDELTEVVLGSHSSGSSDSSGCNWDDFWVCDTVDATETQGRPNNDFLGDLSVKVLLPTGAGDSTEWTPSTGANYAAVDDVPPNTSDYVSATPPESGQKRDLYNCTDLPASVQAVYAVRLVARGTKTDGGTANLKTVIKENDTVTPDAEAKVLSAGSWEGHYGDVHYVKPSDGEVWEVGDVDALQIGLDAVQ